MSDTPEQTTEEILAALIAEIEPRLRVRLHPYAPNSGQAYVEIVTDNNKLVGSMVLDLVTLQNVQDSERYIKRLMEITGWTKRKARKILDEYAAAGIRPHAAVKLIKDMLADVEPTPEPEPEPGNGQTKPERVP